MSAQPVIGDVIHRDGRWLVRVGAVSALALGIAYAIITALYVPMGAPPSGAEARLMYLAQNTSVWWPILDLSVLTDFLFVPVALALYLALKELDRSMMLAATACVGLFIALDLAVTWTDYAALLALSGKYAVATSDSQRAALVAAATYPTAVLESRLLFVYNTLTLSLGVLLTGLVMRKGVFNRGTGYLGLATGIVGSIAVLGSFLVDTLGAAIILASILTTVWVFFVGYRLCRLGWDKV